MAQAVTLDRNPALDAALDDQAAKAGTDLDKSISDVETEAKAHSEKGTELAKTISKARDELGGLKPPSIPDVPEPPQPKYRDPMEGFGSNASIFATFASLLTRRPLLNALNASASVINAQRGQDRQAYDDAIQTWKLNFDKVKQLHDWQKDLYDEIVKKIDTDVKGAQAEFEAYGTALGDKQIVMLAQQHKFDDIVKLLEFRENKMIQMQNHADTIQQHEENKKEREREFDIREKELEENRKARLALTNPQAQAYADFKAANPDATPAQEAAFLQSLRGTRSAATAAVQKYMQENPDATAEDIAKFSGDYSKKVKAASAFGTGKQGDLVRSFNVAISHLNTLDKLANALQNGDVQAINRISQAFQEQFGSAAPTNFDAAKAIVGDEIIKAIVGGGGALADRENAQNQISRAKTPAQLRGVIKTYKELMGGQLKGLKKQYEDTTGMKDFDERLAPETIEELNMSKATGGAPNGKTVGNYTIEQVH